jgi:O-antigen ligase
MYQSYSSRTPSSFDRRSIIWEKAWHAFLQRPFTGWGIENFNTALQANVRPEEIHLTHIRVDKAHNELLEILVAGGFMSFTFYIFLLVFIFIKAYARAIKGKEPAILAMLLGYMVYSVANVQGISQYVLVFFSVGILMASSSHYDST